MKIDHGETFNKKDKQPHQDNAECNGEKASKHVNGSKTLQPGISVAKIYEKVP